MPNTIEAVKHVSELDEAEAHWLLCHSVEGEACPDGCEKAAYPEELRLYQSEGSVYVDIRVYWDWCRSHGYPLPAGIRLVGAACVTQDDPHPHLPCTREIARIQRERDELRAYATRLRDVLRAVRAAALNAIDERELPAELALEIDAVLAGEIA